MASKYLQKFPVPQGFQEILSDFTREVLRDQPSNIIEYAAQYFESLEKGKKFQFDSKYNVKKDDKKYELNYNPKNAEEITKKAGSITANLNKNAPPQVSAAEPKQEEPQAVQSRKNVQQNKAAGEVQQQKPVAVESASNTPPVIGTEKTVTGQQTQMYVDNLANTVSNEEGLRQEEKDSAPENNEPAAQKEEPEEKKQEEEKPAQTPQAEEEKLPSKPQTPNADMMRNACIQMTEAYFEKHDVNKNGYLSSSEMMELIKEVAQDLDSVNGFSEDDVKDFITIVDRDKDGKVSKPELTEFLLKLLKR